MGSKAQDVCLYENVRRRHTKNRDDNIKYIILKYFNIQNIL